MEKTKLDFFLATSVANEDMAPALSVVAIVNCSICKTIVFLKYRKFCFTVFRLPKDIETLNKCIRLTFQCLNISFVL